MHRAPWEPKPRATLENDIWELYDTRADFSLANDLAKQNPEKLKEMQDLFLKEAVKYNVLPIDDRSLERVNAALVGRPDLMAGRTSLTVYEGMTGMSENVFINTKNRSHTITAEVDDSQGRRQGRDPRPGRPVRRLEPVSEGRQADLHLQLPGPEALHHCRRKAVPAGKATIRYEFAYDGGGLGKGGMGTIFVNGKKVAEGRIERTQPMIFSADEGADVGEDGETPVVEDYGIPAPYQFTGKIDKVTIEVKEMKQADKAAEARASAAAEAAHKKAMAD